MKKVIISLFVFFIGICSINANSRISVKFSDCVDGDTAKFIYKDEIITARFLAIDTPETKHPTKGEQPFGKDASEYTCKKLKNAKKIKLEFDDDSDEKDKYGRYLVWVFVDDELLQKKLVSKGLASVTYLYGDYKYTEELELLEQEAEDNKLGIWSIDQTKEDNTTKKEKEKENDLEYYIKNYKETIILVGIVVIMCVFSTKTRKNVKKGIKKELRKELKKKLK